MLLLSLYLGLSPVYRIPGLSEEDLLLFKAAVITAGVSLVLLPPLIRGRLTLPAGLLGPLGFLGLVLLASPGLLQSRDHALALMFVADIAYGAAFAWCFYRLAREGRDVNLVLLRALAILAVFAAIHVAVAMASIPGLMSRCEWDPGVRSIFGAHYPAWSMSLALFWPVTVLLPVAARNTSRLSATLTGAALAVLFLGVQFISGGRTGIMASILSVAALTFFRSSRLLALLMAAVVLIAGVALLDEQCSRHLRLERLSLLFAANEDVPRALNTLSTDRLEGYRAAVRSVSERPWLGHGLGQILVEGAHQSSVEIHNLWLKWAVYCGILAPLWFAVMVGATAFKGLRLLADRRQASDQRASIAVLLLVLACGIFASLFQPNALLGSFQYTSIWWAAAGILAGQHAREYGRGEFRKRLNAKWRRRLTRRLPFGSGSVKACR